MTRKDFLTKAGLGGAGLFLMPSLLASCKPEELTVNFSGKVLIIGAGSAGLMAGYKLAQHGIDFQILEANNRFGGRVKKLEGFADFPIDAGAEWIHTKTKVLGDLVEDERPNEEIETISYRPKQIENWRDGELRTNDWANLFYREYKFYRTTWYDFFDQYVVPSIANRIQYETVVTSIDYQADKTIVMTQDGQVLEADRVIVTVPLSILKAELIEFSPALPASKTQALDTVDFPPGIKVFMEFSERFYPDMLIMSGLGEFLNSDPPLYYDAAFKKDSDRNILALFWVAEEAEVLTSMASEQEIQDYVIGELDEIFEGKASETLLNFAVQNWSVEPYALGSYSFYNDNYSQNVEALRAPIDGKVFFAGEAMIDGDSSTVHGAGFSGIAAAEEILVGE